VTCGDEPDPRIKEKVDIKNNLTLIFRSDANNDKYRGVNLTIMEIDATAATVSDSIYSLIMYIIHTVLL